MAEDIFTILNGGHYFARLHLSQEHLQIEVGSESRNLLAINTHSGLHQYTRLQYGVKTAPATFQHVMHNMICGLSGTEACLGDIIAVAQS